ncbi:hypothetical protein RB195_015452 [Necator americanus]
MARRGIFYNIHESGTARLIFRKEQGVMLGMLETDNGGTLSITGKLSEGSPEPSTSSDPIVMEVLIVDGEEGSSFKLNDVNVFVDGHKIKIENPAISFSSEQRLIGARADVVIHQYMQPSMATEQNEVFVGTMKLHLLTRERPKESIRCESVCEQDVILEQSDDFLA